MGAGAGGTGGDAVSRCRRRPGTAALLAGPAHRRHHAEHHGGRQTGGEDLRRRAPAGPSSSTACATLPTVRQLTRGHSIGCGGRGRSVIATATAAVVATAAAAVGRRRCCRPPIAGRRVAVDLDRGRDHTEQQVGVELDLAVARLELDLDVGRVLGLRLRDDPSGAGVTATIVSTSPAVSSVTVPAAPIAYTTCVAGAAMRAGSSRHHRRGVG